MEMGGLLKCQYGRRQMRWEADHSPKAGLQTSKMAIPWCIGAGPVNQGWRRYTKINGPIRLRTRKRSHRLQSYCVPNHLPHKTKKDTS